MSRSHTAEVAHARRAARRSVGTKEEDLAACGVNMRAHLKSIVEDGVSQLRARPLGVFISFAQPDADAAVSLRNELAQRLAHEGRQPSTRNALTAAAAAAQ